MAYTQLFSICIHQRILVSDMLTTKPRKNEISEFPSYFFLLSLYTMPVHTLHITNFAPSFQQILTFGALFYDIQTQ